jgi:hypothetical protein
MEGGTEGHRRARGKFRWKAVHAPTQNLTGHLSQAWTTEDRLPQSCSLCGDAMVASALFHASLFHESCCCSAAALWLTLACGGLQIRHLMIP